MGVLCKFLGHKVSPKRIRLDPFTFGERARCSRCDSDVIRDDRLEWRAVTRPQAAE